MPIYSFRNKETGEEWDELMSISSAEEYLKENPSIERFISKAPGLVGGTGDRTKTDGGFKEVLSKIAHANPNSQLANDHGPKDRKSVAIRDTVQRVAEKVGGVTSSE